MRTALQLVALLCLLVGASTQADDEKKKLSELEAALEKLQLPGVRINLEERSVDVVSEVCLDEGMLELVACTKDSKEHESIVVIQARPMHIHTALLLLGAKPGNPAMFKLVEEGTDERLVNIPPKGGPVQVSLAWKKDENTEKLTERPISDFIVRADPAGLERKKASAKERRFPTSTFLFAGSQLVNNKEGPRTYLCDRSGNVISLATFGDELLCLPEVHSHQNGALVWQIDKTHLPKVGTEVTLRLRPKLNRDAKEAPQPRPEGADPAK